MKEIAKILGIAVGTASVWVRSIVLSAAAVSCIEQRRFEGLSNSIKARRKAIQKSEILGYVQKDRPSLSKGNLGEAARQIICARLMMAGYSVFRPMFEDTPIDLLVMTKDGSFKRCQCKYIWPRKNGSHAMSLITVRKNGVGFRAVRHRYTTEEVDFFLGYCLVNDSIYVIPNRDLIGREQLTFWITRTPTKNNAKRRTFVADTWCNAFNVLA